MPSNVNRNPAGAVELLNLNLQGEFPRQLTDTIVPTIDVTPFYYNGLLMRNANGSGALTALGQSLGITIPEGETWALKNISIRFVNLDAAAATAGFGLEARQIGTTDTVITFGPATANVLQNQAFSTGFTYEVPVILDDRFLIRCFMNVITGVPVSGFQTFFNVWYFPLTLK
jgi:hypothetical protein